jgi:hypothetical protein
MVGGAASGELDGWWSAPVHWSGPSRCLGGSSSKRDAAGRERLGKLDVRDAGRRSAEVGRSEPEHLTVGAEHHEPTAGSPALVLEDDGPSAAAPSGHDVSRSKRFERGGRPLAPTGLVSCRLDRLQQRSILANIPELQSRHR